MRAQPDDRLVALAREGREAAFEEIVRRYRAGLVPFAAAFAPRDRAEDVVQESLVRAWEALRTSESEIRLKPWLYTIVRNRALNARRDARSHEQLDETIDGVRQPSEIALTNEELGRVVVAVNALPEAQRKALVRSSLEGRTHEQLAAELNTSTGAVRQLIFRARAGLRVSVGALLPLPLVRAMAESGMADAGAAAAGGGALAAGSLGAAGSGSVAGKAIAVAAIAAAVGGSGVAIDQASKADDPEQGSNAVLSRDAEQPGSTEPTGGGSGSSSGGSTDSSGPGGDSQGVGGEDHRDGESDGPGEDGSRDASGSEDGGGSSGPSGSSGSSDDDFDAPERSGDEGTDDSGGSGERSGSSGSGSSGSGGGSGSNGSGRSGSGDDVAEPEVDDFDDGSSGSGSSGSGTSGSGSSGSGSSGSGDGSDDDPLELPEPEDD